MTSTERKQWFYKFCSYYLGAGTKNNVVSTFWKDFIQNNSLTFTDAQLNAFKEKMFVFLDAVSALNPTATSAICSDSNIMTLLDDAFNEVGINVTYQNSGSDYSLIFTLPDTTTKGMFFILGAKWFITRFNQEKLYAEQAKNTMSFVSPTLPDISNLKYDSGGTTYWEYDAVKNRLFIRGSGETSGAMPIYANQNVLSTPFNDVLNTHVMEFNSSITKLVSSAGRLGSDLLKNSGFQITTYVFRHSNSDPLQLDSGWIPSGKSGGTKPVFDIYTDNDVVKNYSYSSNITVNIHPLSEWED